MIVLDSLKTRDNLSVNGQNYTYFSLQKAEKNGLKGVSELPCSLKILLENLIRNEDGQTVTLEDIRAICQKSGDREIAFRPARVLMQDFTGVPAVVDLAAMRDAIKNLGGDPNKINPLTPVDLVVDHSIQVDVYGTEDAFKKNAQLEMQRNRERYSFLRWGQKAFQQFRVVPPDTGICHQVNLEYLAKTVWTQTINDQTVAYPDTLVGTDSHTTMINGLGVLGWGVGGIEAEAAMLGQPISMLIPEVIGVKLIGSLGEGLTATDLVLTITQLLRKKGVVGKFVEYFGPGLQHLTLADRATIANMAPEYGATCGFFPIDEATLDYLRLTGRDEQTIALVEHYAKAQGLWHQNKILNFADTLELDLSSIRPSLAGPKRPQDRVELENVPQTFSKLLESIGANRSEKKLDQERSEQLHDGDVVIAAITSCTNTSNPHVLMAAGLLAKKAREKGLQRKEWVKTSLAPGSKVVTRYLKDAGLQKFLDELGFTLAGYGCTTCIGNAGPLPDTIASTINQYDLVVSAVLSGNRNFEGRIHPQVKANWLASPPLVVAYAIAGTTRINLMSDPIAHDKNNHPVYLKDIWPSNHEIAIAMQKVSSQQFKEQYANVFSGSNDWSQIPIPDSQTYHWEKDSSYIQYPPYFENMKMRPEPITDILKGNILAILGDSITTDHISPAGSIKKESPAGQYLLAKDIAVKDFNSLGARRGNHEVMMRGTFANIRIKNEMLTNIEGGFTKYIPTGETLSIYDAAMRYQKDKTPLIIIAGKEYGTGSSRDWAAKGPKLLGVHAVIAESFERIHRSNLIGMGILPLQFLDGTNRKTLQLDGTEIIDILGIDEALKPKSILTVRIHHQNNPALSGQQNKVTEIKALCRIDTNNEIEYYKNGGILQYVLRNMLN